MQNVAGYTPAQAAAAGTTGVTATNGQVGNLGLTASQEADLVNFLKILSDGYTSPTPPSAATEVPSARTGQAAGTRFDPRPGRLMQPVQEQTTSTLATGE